ncbi:MAG TPA: hypothetical protein VMS41_01270, partial [Gaiellaceae bacterium]|nr:hypothetical protein [Gaiellaceae bacterium]
SSSSARRGANGRDAMSSATSAAKAVSPIGVDSRGLRILKVLGWIAAGALVLGGLDLLGVDVWGWIAGLRDTIQSVSGWYLIAGAALRTAQTAFISLAWCSSCGPHTRTPTSALPRCSRLTPSGRGSTPSCLRAWGRS